VGKYLILAASMGDGHLRVAEQLRHRLIARGDSADVVDVMRVLPFGLGAALRGGYAAMLRHAPWLYDAIYRGFFVPTGGRALRPDPLLAAGSPAVRRLILDRAPDAVVSTFHLCAQLTGRLSARGEIATPSTVVVTDFVAHHMWLHPGNDAFVCVHPAVAAEAARVTGRPAFAAAPAIDEAFTSSDVGEPARSRTRRGLGLPLLPVVLISAGAWGVGPIVETVEAVASRSHLTVVLCGRNQRLRHALETRQSLENLRVLGWRDDVPDLMRASDVLVDNAAGQTAMEALATGLPVVTFAPLPGHGRDGARRMESLGLSTFAADRAQLRQAIAMLAARDSALRHRQIEVGRALFTVDPVEFLDHARVRAQAARPRR